MTHKNNRDGHPTKETGRKPWVTPQIILGGTEDIEAKIVYPTAEIHRYTMDYAAPS